ncbi:MAG: glycerol-3-phosphate 1-O-acyltransferase PlsY [Nitrospirota bacterium]
MTPSGWLPIVLALAGYLLGSIPFGVIVAKGLGTVDPRTAGSRNIGFTNVLRVCGKKAGVLTLLGDVGKGWLPAWAAGALLNQEAAIMAVALAPILGHLFPLFLGFRGGKGVATALGSVLGLVPWLGGLLLLTWLVVAGLWRYSSGAALMAFSLLPLASLASGQSRGFQVFTWIVAGLIILRHQGNIVRLWQGTEPRIGQHTS